MGRRTRVVVSVLAMVLSGCASPKRQAQLADELDSLRAECARLKRDLGQRDDAVVKLTGQVERLKGFSADRPADLFAPAKLEIATLSGGADYDGKPGDDGVTVYLRPRDAEGDIVKAPGRIKIQVLDNTDLTSPKVIGVYEIAEPESVRRAWHGRLGTNHYTIQCPFPPDFKPPASRRLVVSAEFIDFLTGASLTAVKEVAMAVPGG
jgi:outer membrane murein-binding lipoprotein Lpp